MCVQICRHQSAGMPVPFFDLEFDIFFYEGQDIFLEDFYNDFFGFERQKFSGFNNVPAVFVIDFLKFFRGR